MKIHANILAEVPNCWKSIFQKGVKDQLAIHDVLKSKKQWGSKDRKLFGDIMYELIRHFRFFALLRNTSEDPITADPKALIEGYLQYRNSETTYDEFAAQALPESTFAQRASLPDWLDELGRADNTRNSWESDVSSQSSEAPVCMRISTSIVNPKLAVEQLLKLDPSLQQVSETTLLLSKRIDLSNDPGYTNGWYEIQDIGSQQVSEVINPSSNDIVWDVCAGAGGKSLHLADIMKGKGKIIAMDVNENKLKSLVFRLKKARLTNIEVRLNKPNEDWNTEGLPTPNKIIIDAPCTGTGTWRRNPDTRWKTDPKMLESLVLTQQQLLQMGIKHLPSNSSLFYITCSILPQENQFQIKNLIQKIPTVMIVNELTIHPKQGGSDGFYLVELKNVR